MTTAPRRTCWPTGADCSSCGAPLATDNRSVWCTASPDHTRYGDTHPASPSVGELALYYTRTSPDSDVGRLAVALRRLALDVATLIEVSAPYVRVWPNEVDPVLDDLRQLGYAPPDGLVVDGAR